MFYEKQRASLLAMKELMLNTKVNPAKGHKERHEMMKWQKVVFILWLSFKIAYYIVEGSYLWNQCATGAVR